MTRAAGWIRDCPAVRPGGHTGETWPQFWTLAQSNGENALASWVLGEGWEGLEVNRCPGGGGGLVEGRRGARQNRVTPVSRSRRGAGGPRAPPASHRSGRPRTPAQGLRAQPGLCPPPAAAQAVLCRGPGLPVLQQDEARADKPSCQLTLQSPPSRCVGREKSLETGSTCAR